MKRQFQPRNGRISVYCRAWEEREFAAWQTPHVFTLILTPALSRWERERAGVREHGHERSTGLQETELRPLAT